MNRFCKARMPKKPKSKAAVSELTIPPKKIRRTYKATAAPEEKLREVKDSSIGLRAGFFYPW
jgi:hypothetical protein